MSKDELNASCISPPLHRASAIGKPNAKHAIKHEEASGTSRAAHRGEDASDRDSHLGRCGTCEESEGQQAYAPRTDQEVIDAHAG